jgi:hypothetical protein
MVTEKTTFNSKVYIFAKAKSDYQLANLDPGELPFTYVVKSYDYGDEACVRIAEQEIAVTVPAGIDITMECIANLREQIDVLEKETIAKVKELEQRIRNIALIEYKPS